MTSRAINDLIQRYAAALLPTCEGDRERALRWAVGMAERVMADSDRPRLPAAERMRLSRARRRTAAA